MAKKPYTISAEDRNALRQIGARRKTQHTPPNQRKIASPDVRKLAEENGFSLEEIPIQSGSNRVLESDVERFIQQKHYFKKIQEHWKTEEEKKQKETERILSVKLEKDADAEMPVTEANETVETNAPVKPMNETCVLPEETDPVSEATIETAETPIPETAEISETEFSDESTQALSPESPEEDEKPEETDALSPEIPDSVTETPLTETAQDDHAESDLTENIPDENDTFDSTEDVVENTSVETDLTSDMPETEEESDFTEEITDDSEAEIPVQDEDDNPEDSEYTHDLIVIGCGLSGYQTALSAVEAGLKTAIVEKDLIGGKAMKDGIFPIMYLRHNAAFVRQCRQASHRGLVIEGMSVNPQKMMSDKASKIETYREKMRQQILSAGIDLYEGNAEVSIDRKVTVTMPNERLIALSAEHIVLATGTTSHIPKRYASTDNIFTDSQVHDLERIPSEMIIVGNGKAACEFAAIYRAFGTKVMIVSPTTALIPEIDDDLCAFIEENLESMGIKLIHKAYIDDVYRDSLGELHVEICTDRENQSWICSDICVIQERIPNLSCLKNSNVEQFGKGVAVKASGKTLFSGIYAVGSATGRKNVKPATVLKQILGDDRLHHSPVQSTCIHLIPEIYSIGLSQKEADLKEISIDTIHFASENDAFLSENKDKKFIKLISDTHDRTLLGAVYCCNEAKSLAILTQDIIAKGGTLQDLIENTRQFPSLSMLFNQPVYS